MCASHLAANEIFGAQWQTRRLVKTVRSVLQLLLRKMQMFETR
jgi:hypothetical protein